MKICRKCNALFSGKRCILCHREAEKKRYQDNRLTISQSRKEAYNQDTNGYRTKSLARRRTYYQLHKELCYEQTREWVLSHLDQVRVHRQRARAKVFPEVFSIYWHTRRARLNSVGGHTLLPNGNS